MNGFPRSIYELDIKKHMALSIYEKEFLAILLAVQKWKYYLESKKFIIKRA